MKISLFSRATFNVRSHFGNQVSFVGKQLSHVRFLVFLVVFFFATI